MKNELTPQIAALYIGQKCTVTSKNSSFLSDYYGDGESVTITPNFLQEIVNGRCEVILHLRPLDSLTEAEARELYKIKYGETWEKSFHDINIKVSPCLENFWKSDIELYNDEGKLLIGSPAIWLKLLSWGFDLFGLIDQGLAKPLNQ